MGATSFRLCKWYADCVCDDGELVIAYVADLSWRGLELKYASVLHTFPAGKTSSQTTLLNVPLPAHSREHFEWHSPSLNFSGTWLPQRPEISATLFDSPSGFIQWDCLQPLSEATLTIDGRELSGLGYVERLDTTLPPWNMPLDRLNWGRFTSANNSIVWIEWQGEHPLRHVWVDGKETEANVNDFSIELAPNNSLELQQDAVLRDGVIGETVLHVIPKWLGPLPGRVLGMHERKWRSRGKLFVPDAPPVEGWAIHEVVQWPK